MSPFSRVKPALGKCFTIEGGKVNNSSLHDSLRVDSTLSWSSRKRAHWQVEWYHFFPRNSRRSPSSKLSNTMVGTLKQQPAFRMMSWCNLFHKSMLRDPSVSYLTPRDDTAISLSHHCFNLNKNEVLYCVSHRIRCPLLSCPCGTRAHCGTRHPCGKRTKPANYNFEMWVLCVLCRQSVLSKNFIARWRKECEHAPWQHRNIDSHWLQHSHLRRANVSW